MSVLPLPQDVAEVIAETAAVSKTARLDVFGTLLGRVIERFPQLQANGEAYRLLGEAIDMLEEAGVVTKPKGTKLYDHHTHRQYPLPVHVTRVAARKRRERESVAWHPLLAGADGVTNRDRRAMLMEINRYLIERPEGLLETIPAQERSLMIFGADKRLSSFSGISLPGGGTLTRADLGFKPSEPPLAYAAFPGSRQAEGLVVENSATYDSFCAWTASVGRFRAIVFGGGNSLLKAPNRLEEIALRHGLKAWRYFGDVDAEGLRIPAVLAERNAEAGMVPVLPLGAAYSWLVRHGRFVPEEHVSKTADERRKWGTFREKALRWIGDDEVVRAVDESVRSGTLIPQEWLGGDVLAKAVEIDGSLPPPPYLPQRFQQG